jgi:hypothetical protein
MSVGEEEMGILEVSEGDTRGSETKAPGPLGGVKT